MIQNCNEVESGPQRAGEGGGVGIQEEVAQQLAQRRDTQFILQVGPWKLGLSFFSISCMMLLWCDVPVYLGLEITI